MCEKREPSEEGRGEGNTLKKKKKKNSVSFSYFKKGGAESSLKGLSKIWLCNVSLSRGLLFPATLDVHLLSIWVFQVGLPIVIMD